MIDIKTNFSLCNFNSLQLDHVADYFCEVFNEQDCIEALEFAKEKQLQIQILGEGTNVVFSDDYQGLVIKVSLKGINSNEGLVSIASGESWHESVLWTLKKNLFGLENLSLIPGTVGAAPIQNIGAYGAEISSFIHSVKFLNLNTRKIEEFTNEECQFNYRNSIFKELKDYLILEVKLRLFKKENINISYKSLKDYMEAEGLDLSKATATQVCRCVCELRNTILPDPKKVPNAGSFFKNILITKDEYNDLREIIEVPYHQESKKMVKVSSAFLIEKAGWKGYAEDNVSVSDKHSLVFLCNGKATGKEVMLLADKITKDVHQKFGVNLIIEPSVI
jgi:UDP-N-acetylmuramate dehydrogenase